MLAPPQLRSRPPLSAESAQAYLAKVESAYVRRIVLAGVFGGLACLILPVIVAGAMEFQWHLRRPTTGFWKYFAVVSVTLNPVLFGIALLTKRSLAEGFVEEVGYDHVLSPFQFRSKMTAHLFLLDLVLFAPRGVMYAFEQWKAREKVGRLATEAVADAVVTLYAAREAIGPGSLLKEDQPASELDAVLGPLMLHEVIGISKGGERVWMTTEMRERLAKMAG